MMPAPIKPEVRAAILAHRTHGLSHRKILEQLFLSGMAASKGTVANVIRDFKWEQQGNVKSPKRLGNQCLPSVRLRTTIEKVRNLVGRPDPWTLTAISKKLGLSLTTVWRIIHKDLHGVLRHKTKTHALSDKMVEQRLQKGPRLLQHLQGRKLTNIVSIDEAWCYMSHVNGRRRVFYQFRGQQSPRSFLKYWRKKKPRGVMFVAGISWRGTTAIRFVPQHTKVDADFYINKVLRPLFRKDIPRLFGKARNMAVLHHDSAPAHKAKKTVQ